MCTMTCRASRAAAGCSTRSLLGKRPLSISGPKRRRIVQPASAKGGSEEAGPTNPQTGLGLQAVWYAAEQFGNLVGLARKQGGGAGAGAEGGAAAPAAAAAMSREEALAEIRADYDQNYFVSGKGSMRAYAEDCLFADPFAGFKGVARFKKNVGNLGSLMRDVRLELTNWSEGEDSLRTSWRFSAILDLPWKPLLAAAGSTTHVFDKETGLVVKHLEEWDVEPGKVLRQLLRPAAKMPGNRWEAGMRALHDGDGQGVWLAAAPGVLQATALLAPALLLAHAARGEGLPGWGGAALEAGCYAALLAAAATEVSKILKSLGVGESL